MWHRLIKQGWWLAFICLWLSGNAQAARVADLYIAHLLVAEQSLEADPALVAEGLKQVIVKVSGRRELVSNPRIREALAAPDPYIQQFSYQPSSRPIKTEDGREVLAQQLSIEFSQPLVDRLLGEAGTRPLGSERPGLLLWLVEERGGQREYLGRNEDPVFATMLDRARERGLPIFRPLMDMEDEQALPVSDAWGFFADSIRKASARYQADAIMVGRLYTDNAGFWRSQWQLIWPQETMGFEGRGRSLEQQLAFAVETAADRLFADFVRPATGFDEGGVQMQVDGVNGLDDYFQIRNYLNELPAVSSVEIRSLSGDRLVLRLMVDGSLKQVQNAIALNQRFQPQVTQDAANDGIQIRYRWQE